MKQDREPVALVKPLRRLTSVLAMDLCAYTTQVEQDEDRAIGIVAALRDLIGGEALKHRGRIFHTAADGFLAEFPSAQDCLVAALAIMQGASEGRDSALGADSKLRIGLHVGDVIDQPDGDLLGHGVNVAVRLQQNASPNQILASEHFTNLVASSSDRKFVRLGSLQLKNIKEPVTAYDVGLDPKVRSLLARFGKIRPAIAGFGLVVAILAAGTAYSGLIKEPDKSIDRRAIESATEVLVQSNLPVDAAVSALLETGSFDAAIESLLDERTVERDELSVRRQAELLHQAGALAFSRDIETAQRIYRQILAIRPDDWAAALQLARIHITRSEKAEAASLIEVARRAPQLTLEQALLIEIERVRANAPPYAASSQALNAISEQAKDAGLISVGLRAASYGTIHQNASIWVDRDPTADELFGLVDQTEAIIEAQSEHSSYVDLARSSSLLAGLHFGLEDYAAALAQYEQVAEMEKVLARPNGQLRMLSNIARSHLKLGNLDEAARMNDQAIQFGVEQDLVMTTHFNLALSAEIAIAAGRNDKGCRRLGEAKSAWPPSQDWPTYLVELGEGAECSVG